MRERKEAKTLTAMEGHAFVQRFFDENVLRWLRLVLLRHTDAQFRLIGTKRDKVSNSQWTDVRIDLNLRLLAFLKGHGHQVTIQDDIRCTLVKEFDQPMLTTSVMDRESLNAALQSIQRTILKLNYLTFFIVSNSNLSFSMPKAYTQVLEYIVRERRLAKKSETRKEQLEKVVVPINDICGRLMRLAGLTGGACMDILRTLHNLGDVRWYESEDYGQDFKDLIILDPTILLDIIREVINHEYDAKKRRGV
ncbi:hypothetical protein PHYPSEUDO_000707 [Phytophthora pseudosyringae]|uniref:Uncharacterized protein n=1 Tax=Phytophthora pseudosyringae TaxID=221518 RepID=A0A8T1W1T1_9STRA|nr:hypothetical protein PHYPSEUDO_000707 [Phytophthora pseudosyringae]